MEIIGLATVLSAKPYPKRTQFHAPFTHALQPDGSALGGANSGRVGVAVRTEMGWLSLSRLPRREVRRASVQGRPAVDPLLSGTGRSPARLKAQRFVLDGEIVVPSNGGFSFDALLQRIHPAASRIQKLATETPALLIVFDLLVNARGELLTHLPLPSAVKRWSSSFAARALGAKPLRLSPTTTQLAVAKGWLKRVGNALDGVIAKRRDLPYLSGERSGMQKIKNYRSADCVVGGFRYNEGKRVVGSLLLGPVRRRGPSASRRLHLGHRAGRTSRRSPRSCENLIGRRDSPEMRRAGRADGRPAARPSGIRLSRSSSSRSASTISAASASVTVRGCCAGGRTRRRDNAHSSSWPRRKLT